MADAVRLITPIFRMSHPTLVEPKAFQPKGGEAKGAPRFSCLGIYEPDDLKKFKTPNEKGDALVDADVVQLAVAAVKAQWPAETDIPTFLKALNMNKMWPFLDGTKEADSANGKAEHYRGKKIIKMSSSEKVPPNLFVRENGKTLPLNRGVPSDLTRAKSLFVGGNYAYAELTINAGDTPQKHVKFYLNSVVFLKVGERLGQGQSLIGRFDGVEGGVDDSHDPTAGMDDEIPF